MKDTYGNIIDLVVYNIDSFHPDSTKKSKSSLASARKLQSMQSFVSLHSRNGKLFSALRVILLSHPFFKRNFLLFIKLLTLGTLSAPPLTIKNSSDLEKLNNQIKH